MNAPLKLGRIGQISRSVKDIKASQAWYGEVLRLPHLYTFGKLAFFDCGGTRLYLNESDNPSPGESVLYLLSRIFRRRIRSSWSGASSSPTRRIMIHRHADGMEEWMAFFRDPEGRPLAIMAQVKASG